MSVPNPIHLTRLRSTILTNVSQTMPMKEGKNETTDAISEATTDGANNEVADEDLQDNLSMAWWVQLLWTLVFAQMIITATYGNLIVMWIVVCHKRMRSATNYLLLNLSVADLMMATLNCAFNFAYMLQANWQFGGWYCSFSNFIAHTTVAASVFTLVAMSRDRYLAIVYPLHRRMSKRATVISIVLIWCCSMFLAIPCLLYSRTITYRYREKERTACILMWPDGQPTDSRLDFCYQVLYFVFTYVMPMISMCACYWRTTRILCNSQSIGECTNIQKKVIRAKRKIAKMIIFAVIKFGFCWLPYHSYFIYIHFDRSIIYTRYVQHVYLAFYWLAMANAMTNPLIYYWMNAKFREYFRRAVCCCCCCWTSRKDFKAAPQSGRGGEEHINLRLLQPTSTNNSTVGRERQQIQSI